jgi:tetratricopeptide (TPR) repeat protein
LIRKLLAVLVLMTAVAGTGFVHAQIPPATAADRGEAFVPEPVLAKVLALGFDAVMADYHWLQAVQIGGQREAMTADTARHLGKLIDVVTTLDPWVDHPYRFAAVWLTESEENVREGIRLLRRGIAHHPDDWRNWFYLGFNYQFYLLETEEAALALNQASLLPGSPQYLPRLVARLRAETGDIDVAQIFLLEMIRNTDDESALADYRAALDEIEVEKKARVLDRAREAFAKLSGRDIMSVDELVRGPHAVLAALPSPEPDSLPAALARGSVWELDLETDRITSSYYGSRYEVHRTAFDHQRARRWKAEREARERAERRETEKGSHGG